MKTHRSISILVFMTGLLFGCQKLDRLTSVTQTQATQSSTPPSANIVPGTIEGTITYKFQGKGNLNWPDYPVGPVDVQGAIVLDPNAQGTITPNPGVTYYQAIKGVTFYIPAYDLRYSKTGGSYGLVVHPDKTVSLIEQQGDFAGEPSKLNMGWSGYKGTTWNNKHIPSLNFFEKVAFGIHWDGDLGNYEHSNGIDGELSKIWIPQ
jgi:hypothetical protein